MKTVMVTGGAGFIGSNFVLYLLATHSDIRVVNVDALTYAGNLENLQGIDQNEYYVFERADIRNTKEMARIIRRYKPWAIVNFAAESHVDRSIQDPVSFVDTNVMGTTSLLRAARDAWEEPNASFGNHKFLQVSTDEVYGTLSLDEPEIFFTEETPLQPHSPYSASKASADFLVKAYSDTYGLPVNITRCSNNYGPFQFPEKLIPLMINNAIHHEQLPVYGDGQNVRDWLYVIDHCKAIDLVLNGGRLSEVYNIGGHNERSNIAIVKTIIAELAATLKDAAINEDLIAFVTDRKGHDRRYGIAPDKIKRDLGWEPETNFEEGIVKTIHWYLDNAQWVQHVTSGQYREYYNKMYAEALS